MSLRVYTAPDLFLNCVWPSGMESYTFFFHPRLFFQASNIVRSVIQFLRIINIFMTRPVVCMQLKPRFTRIHVQSLQKGWEDVISRRNVNI